MTTRASGLLLVDDERAVIRHVKQWAIAVVEALVGLAIPVPHEADADIPRFLRCAFERHSLAFGIRYSNPDCHAKPFADGDVHVGTEQGIGVVVAAGEEATFAAASRRG